MLCDGFDLLLPLLIQFILFYSLGILAIFSAIRYTVGNTAYGYRGWRSICFIFFGLVSVGFFLYSKQIDTILFCQLWHWFIERRVLNLII
jgi:1,4-dihydroxy-2-naphthoate octaprenyltransferase